MTSGHRFTSHIWVQPLRRALRAGWVQANMNSSMPSDMFKAGARAFAVLRPIADASAQDRIRQQILDAFVAFEAETVGVR